MEQKTDTNMAGQPYSSSEESSTSMQTANEATEGDMKDSMGFVKGVLEKMKPFLLTLDLDGKTPEEIRQELYVDFSTLPVGIPVDEKQRARIMLNLMKQQLFPENIRQKAETLHPSDRANYDLKKYNNGIVALGVENFMVAATQFCEDEAAGGEIEIVSVGSGDGTIEKDIMAEYRSRFRKDLPRIKLVDPDPRFDGIVDFKTVDHLIEEKPNVVGDCVVFIIWPLPVSADIMWAEGPAPYDVEAIFKLQPRAVFIVYECMGGSGSNGLRTFLRDDKLETLLPEECGYQNWLSKFHRMETSATRLENYSITEIAHQKIHLPRSGTAILRMVKLKKTEGKPAQDCSPDV